MGNCTNDTLKCIDKNMFIFNENEVVQKYIHYTINIQSYKIADDVSTSDLADIVELFINGTYDGDVSTHDFLIRSGLCEL